MHRATWIILTDGSSVTIIPTGPCTLIGPTACYAGHMFLGSSLEHNLIWLIDCYLFRYYVLYVRDPSIKSIIFAAVLVYTPSFIHIAIWIKLFDAGQMEIKMNGTELLANQLEFSEMKLTGRIVYWSSIVVFVQLVFTALLVILTFQVCIPIWFFLGVFFLLPSFLAMYSQSTRPDTVQYAITISFMLAPVVSPFAYIFFVPHY
nr:hypothetical protein F26G5.3 - Caenorhabditis elegans [Caenorhabditis elegans]